jgi:hypothetical protein
MEKRYNVDIVLKVVEFKDGKFVTIGAHEHAEVEQ